MTTPETPIPTGPLAVEEQEASKRLVWTDIAEIDEAILAHCSQRWYKLARVLSMASEVLQPKYPALSFPFYTERVRELVANGQLMAQGNLDFTRFSEIRLSEANADR